MGRGVDKGKLYNGGLEVPVFCPQCKLEADRKWTGAGMVYYQCPDCGLHGGARENPGTAKLAFLRAVKEAFRPIPCPRCGHDAELIYGYVTSGGRDAIRFKAFHYQCHSCGLDGPFHTCSIGWAKRRFLAAAAAQKCEGDA